MDYSHFFTHRREYFAVLSACSLTRLAGSLNECKKKIYVDLYCEKEDLSEQLHAIVVDSLSLHEKFEVAHSLCSSSSNYLPVSQTWAAVVKGVCGSASCEGQVASLEQILSTLTVTDDVDTDALDSLTPCVPLLAVYLREAGEVLSRLGIRRGIDCRVRRLQQELQKESCLRNDFYTTLVGDLALGESFHVLVGFTRYLLKRLKRSQSVLQKTKNQLQAVKSKVQSCCHVDEVNRLLDDANVLHRSLQESAKGTVLHSATLQKLWATHWGRMRENIHAVPSATVLSALFFFDMWGAAYPEYTIVEGDTLETYLMSVVSTTRETNFSRLVLCNVVARTKECPKGRYSALQPIEFPCFSSVDLARVFERTECDKACPLCLLTEAGGPLLSDWIEPIAV
ncbi:hypothetical protein ADEAN_000150700 [Angomonas deanei]|uniref:Uncharacterized protein n=1 Tax=Angomonas deanei TaxID=59799 RepID=A0A7G2C5N0_9TRYP|nr:hypothetical protein ADEAN_000150700 [Angomonas deanei]